VFRKNELKAEIARAGMTYETLARAIDINPATLYRKINGHTDFYRYEIVKITEVLHLDDATMRRIFFAPDLRLCNITQDDSGEV
jgi:DNA-binding XRE family transcriptional regulator